MARFFIDRPVFAWVLAIVVMLAGVASIFTLPVAQYPTIAPPAIQITANYPGASAKTLEDTVTQVIEQQMSGLDNFLYMASTSDDSGTATITLTFAPGTSADVAQVQVQNKLSLATPNLPQIVQQLGIRVTKSSGSYLLWIAFTSQDGSLSKDDLTNYVASHVLDPVTRVDGVGQTLLLGSQYAMRVWLDPARLTSLGLTPIDVTAAIRSQNVQVAGGQLGGAPAVPGTALQATVTAAALLRTPEQFGNILLKVNQDGSRVRLKDVARVSLGAENYLFDTKYMGKPSATLGIQLASGANALATVDAIQAKLNELSQFFPPGLVVNYQYDTSPFVRTSIEGVVKTLLEGIVLVFLVMYLFLQNLRATIVPTIAVPVVLLGTIAIMSLMGFSINTLSMFGLVLAIGLLVDDAILVVENVERVMAEEGLSAREATRKAMSQLTGALIGTSLVLSAVFVPVAFLGGSVGVIYRQFALTIVSAMVLSVLVALILTPALCATILKPSPPGQRNGFFGWFNRTFDQGRDKYEGGVRHVIRRSGRWLVIYLAVIVAVGLLFARLPKSFLPDEDQGYMIAIVQTPSGSTQETTARTLAHVSDYLLNNEQDIVESTLTINGFSAAGRGQNAGTVFVRLKPFAQRQRPDQTVQALQRRTAAHYASYKDATVIPVNPPAIRELGNASGFAFELMDNAGLGRDALITARDRLLDMASKDPSLERVRPNGLNDTVRYQIDVDREKAEAMGVSTSSIDQTFSIAWASQYVNIFLDADGRIKKVYVQADAPFRMRPEDLGHWYVRNESGGMVPFSSFATGHWTYGASKLERYNGVSSVEILGQASAGMSSGQAMAAMEELAKHLPQGIGHAWTGLSFQESQSGSLAPILYAISILVVFLCLAALYESWSIPFSVLMVVPLGVVGALLAVTLRGLDNDVYFQVGLLTTVGLSAKNAILIVEFARELQLTQKMRPIDAALEAARQRLRPILMTSLTFILGVLPLALGDGAGSASQRAIGTGVIGGMITATFLAIFMIPMFYVKVRGIFAGERHSADDVLSCTPVLSRGDGGSGDDRENEARQSR
ncbi:efflux RND transporter permease subunit [Burkholderia sp. AW49-1]